MQTIVINARRTSWMCFLLAATLSCNTRATSPDGTAVESVAITPPTASLQVGSSVALTAQALDATGNAIPSVNVAWASEDSTIAQVSPTGLVIGLKAGVVRISASSWGKDGVATITVSPLITVMPAVARIVIAPSNPAVIVGQSIQLTAAVLDAANRSIQGIPVSWSSSNTSRATVDQTGLVRGIGTGSVTITASAGGKNGTTTVRVDR